MKADEVYEILCKFIENDFAHLRKKVDWVFYTIITLLLGTIANLIIMLVKR